LLPVAKLDPADTWVETFKRGLLLLWGLWLALGVVLMAMATLWPSKGATEDA